MKYFYLLFFLLATPLFVSAQGNNCGDVEPTVTCPADLTLCLTELSDPLVLTSSPTLPDMEYVIIDESMPASSGTGPAVVGIDSDGVFTPNDYNIAGGSQVTIIPITYDLLYIQQTIDIVLTGTFNGFSCCVLAQQITMEDICGQIMAAGINQGSDITSLSQVFDLANIILGTNDTASFMDFIDGIAELNSQLSGAVPASCGGGREICYAYGNSCTFDVIPDTHVFFPSDHNNTSGLHQAGINIVSSATVANNTMIEYEAADFITLLPNFCVVQGAVFCAEIVPCEQ